MRDDPREQEVERRAAALVEHGVEHAAERLPARRRARASRPRAAATRSAGRAGTTATPAVQAATPSANQRRSASGRDALRRRRGVSGRHAGSGYPPHDRDLSRGRRRTAASLESRCRSTSTAARTGTCSRSSSGWTTRRRRSARSAGRARSRRCSTRCRSSSRARASTRPTTGARQARRRESAATATGGQVDRTDAKKTEKPTEKTHEGRRNEGGSAAERLASPTPATPGLEGVARAGRRRLRRRLAGEHRDHRAVLLRRVDHGGAADRTRISAEPAVHASTAVGAELHPAELEEVARGRSVASGSKQVAADERQVEERPDPGELVGDRLQHLLLALRRV